MLVSQTIFTVFKNLLSSSTNSDVVCFKILYMDFRVGSFQWALSISQLSWLISTCDSATKGCNVSTLIHIFKDSEFKRTHFSAQRAQWISTPPGTVLGLITFAGRPLVSLLQNMTIIGNVLCLLKAKVQYLIALFINAKLTVCCTSIMIGESAVFLGV